MLEKTHEISILIMRLEEHGYFDVIPKEHLGERKYLVRFSDGQIWYNTYEGVFEVINDNEVNELSRKLIFEA